MRAALLVLVFAAAAHAQQVSAELKQSAQGLVDAAQSVRNAALLTSNPLNNNTENSGYYLTFHAQNFVAECSQLRYWIVNKRPNLEIAIKRYERCKLVAAKIEGILEPAAVVELEGSPVKNPSYPFVKARWPAVKALMTKIEGLLSGGGTEPTPPPGGGSDTPPPADPPPADPPADPPPTDPSPAPSPADPPVPAPK
jgi:hypothetical protein